VNIKDLDKVIADLFLRRDSICMTMDGQKAWHYTINDLLNLRKEFIREQKYVDGEKRRKDSEDNGRQNDEKDI
jgi:hypothetical protein